MFKSDQRARIKEVQLDSIALINHLNSTTPRAAGHFLLIDNLTQMIVLMLDVML